MCFPFWNVSSLKAKIYLFCSFTVIPLGIYLMDTQKTSPVYRKYMVSCGHP